MLNKEDIKRAGNLKYEDASAWGGTVRLRVMTANQLTRYLQSMPEVKTGENPSPEQSVDMIVQLLGNTLCDAAGNLLFESEEEAKILADKDMKTLMHLFRIAQKLNGLTEESVVEIEKNSEASQ